MSDIEQAISRDLINIRDHFYSIGNEPLVDVYGPIIAGAPSLELPLQAFGAVEKTSRIRKLLDKVGLVRSFVLNNEDIGELEISREEEFEDGEGGAIQVIVPEGIAPTYPVTKFYFESPTFLAMADVYSIEDLYEANEMGSSLWIQTTDEATKSTVEILFGFNGKYSWEVDYIIGEYEGEQLHFSVAPGEKFFGDMRKKELRLASNVLERFIDQNFRKPRENRIDNKEWGGTLKSLVPHITHLPSDEELYNKST